MRALGRLLRLSLAPSALADVAAGCVLGSGGAWPAGQRGLLLMLSSLGIYHGAMALNDWADREGDASTRPDRPVPSGAVPASLAAALGAGLVLAGVAAAFAVGRSVGLWMTTVALLAVGYDLVGRGAWLGPALLASCRFGNLGVGLAFAPVWAGREPHLSWLAPALAYGGYVFFVSRLGRLEDDEDAGALGERPTVYLRAATLCLVLLPATGWLLPGSAGAGPLAAAVVAWAGAAALARSAWGRVVWTRAEVGRHMGMALRRLLVFTAATCLLGAAWGPTPWFAAAAILAGYPLSYALRGVFPPT